MIKVFLFMIIVGAVIAISGILGDNPEAKLIGAMLVTLGVFALNIPRKRKKPRRRNKK